MIYKDDEGYEYVKSLKEVREFLKEKNDKWWNEERKDLDLKYYVPTDIICEALEQYEVGIGKNVYDYIENNNKSAYRHYMTFTEYLQDHNVENLGGDNTYNHNGRPQNDINWEVFKLNDDRYWVVIMFHIGGDIRGNYTDEIVLEFEYETQFLEVLNEITSEYGLYFELKVDNKVYELAPYILNECLEVYDRETDDYIYHIFGIDDEEVIEEIREQENKIYEGKVSKVLEYMLDNDIVIMAEYDNFLNEEYYEKEHWVSLLLECKGLCDKEIARKKADEEISRYYFKEYKIKNYVDEIILKLGGNVNV